MVSIFKYCQVVAWILLSSFFLISQDYLPGFVENLMADGLNPTAMTIDHHNRIWIAEKDGRVLLINNDGVLNPDPVITIEVDDFNERGLIGLILHPDLDNSPYLYIYYTVSGRNHNRLSRWTIQGDFAVPGSEEVLLDIDVLSGGIHNGGGMAFSEEGYLFLGTGDGGNPANAQDLNTLLGKIIRLKDDGCIPTDNPYYHELQDQYRAIYATGLRNPFCLFWDESERILWSTDVGQGNYEEINIISPEGNYGWPLVEGPNINNSETDHYIDPFYYYDHGDGCAITAFTVYHPESSAMPDTFQNIIFFSDYCNGKIYYVDPNALLEKKVFAHNIERPLYLEYNHETGQLYLLTRAGIGGGSPVDNTATNQGSLWEINYVGEGKPFITRNLPDSILHPENEPLELEIKAVGSLPLEYTWYVDSMVLFQQSSNLIRLSLASRPKPYKLYCIVRNHFGQDTSFIANVLITNNTRPIPEIVILSNDKFSAGDPILFSGQILDSESGLLDPSVYHWEINLHHNDHFHPVSIMDGQKNGEIVLPTQGETDTSIWIRINLSGKDQEGLKGQSSIDVFPQLDSMVIDGPRGVKINTDGKIVKLPYRYKSLRNLKRTILVPEMQIVNNKNIYFFNQWHDGDSSLLKVITINEHSNRYKLIFDTFILGTGTGLAGTYYYDPSFKFQNQPVFTRIDSLIDFNWGMESPDPEKILPDGFLIRWEGLIQPYRRGAYRFNVRNDDGFRLWVNDEVIIDDWLNHPPKDNSGFYFFENELAVPIRIEYFEKGGGALVALSWEAEFLENETIPTSQLYPHELRNIEGHVWLDKNNNGIFEKLDSTLKKVNVYLLNSESRIISASTTDDNGKFAFRYVQSDTYRLKVNLNDSVVKNFVPVLNIDTLGYTTTFVMDYNHDIYMPIAFESNPLLMDNSIDFTSRLTLYPNPTNDIMHFYTNKHVNLRKATLSNLPGTLFYSLNKKEIDNNSIDLSPFPRGVYIFSVYTEKEIISKKILKF